MKRLYLATLAFMTAALVILPSTAQAATVGVNLLVNPGFESGALGQFDAPGTVIDGWGTWGTEGWYHTDHNLTPGGERAIKTWWDCTGIAKEFPAVDTPGYYYIISGSAFSPSPGILIWDSVLWAEWWRDDNDDGLAEWGVDTQLAKVEVGRFYGDGVDPLDTWKFITGDIIPPAGTEIGKIAVHLADPVWNGMQGSVSWDEIRRSYPRAGNSIVVGDGTSWSGNYRQEEEEITSQGAGKKGSSYERISLKE